MWYNGRMKKQVLSVLASFAACVFAVNGAVFHVSATAAKGGDGSPAKPFGSPREAVEAARKTPGPHEIVVADGRYAFDSTLDLSPKDRGLVIRAANPGKAVFSGGIRIGGWTKTADSPIWWADVPGDKNDGFYFRSLFVNGKPAERAVYPTDGTYLKNTREWKVRWLSTVGNGWERKPTMEELTTMPYKKGDLPPGFDCASADVRVYHSWDESLVRVLSNDVENAVLRFRARTCSPAGAWNHNYVVYNIREGMSRPGQWRFDVTERRLYYWPKPGEDMAKADVVVPRLTTLVSIKGGGGKIGPVRDVVLDGFVFECTVPPEKSAGFAGTGLPGTIDCRTLDGCRFERLLVRCTGAIGLVLRTVKNCRVENCEFVDTGSCAASIYGENVKFLSNRILRTGTVYSSAVGVHVSGNDILFKGNYISDTPYSGVSFGGKRHVYEDNVVRRVMLVMHDGAAFYGGGASEDCVMRRNTVFDIVPNGKGAGCSAFYFDEGAHGGLVESNRTDGVAHPIHNHMARSIVVRDNLMCSTNKVRITFSRCNGCEFSGNEIRTDAVVEMPRPEATPVWHGNIIRPYAGMDVKCDGPGREYVRPEVTILKPRKDALPAPAVEKAPPLDGSLKMDFWPGVWGSVTRGADFKPFYGPPLLIRAAHDATNLYVAVRVVLFRHEDLALGNDLEKSDYVTLDFQGLRLRGFADGTSNARFFYGGWEKGKTKGFGKMALYAFAVPFADIGVEPPPAAGRTIPFNCTVRNGFYGETRYWESPSTTNMVPGKIVLK